MIYPVIQPYEVLSIVADEYSVVVEQSGNPNGIPAIFLHGGPGSPCQPTYRGLFDPDRFRIIMFDQRGCGKSMPLLSLSSNSTSRIVADIELIRKRLGIQRWIIVGGSWGSLLALCYTFKYPSTIAGLALRGVFTARAIEIEWLYGPKGGARCLNPAAWNALSETCNASTANELIAQLHDAYFGTDSAHRRTQIARQWASYEQALTSTQRVGRVPDDDFCHSVTTYGLHYFHNGFFLESDDYVLRTLDANDFPFPVQIVQGTLDVVCPAISAYLVSERMANSELHLVPCNGHSIFDTEIFSHLSSAILKLGDLYEC